MECLDRPLKRCRAIFQRLNCTQHVAIKGIICVNHAQDYHWINYTSLIPPRVEMLTSCYRGEVFIIIRTIFGRGGWIVVNCGRLLLT